MSKSNYCHILRARKVLTLLLIVAFNSAMGQTLTSSETVINYTPAQKRLLVISTFEFTNLITQNNLDQDSIINMSCRLTGMPFLIAYLEYFSDSSTTVAANLINSGHIGSAKLAVGLTMGETRIHGNLAIAIWYLHQDGARKQDLDSASRFIKFAYNESIARGSARWKNECMFQLAELQYQRGNAVQSDAEFTRLSVIASQDGIKEVAARCYMRLGDLLFQVHTAKENFYNKSLAIYEALGLSEKQISLLWKLALYHLHANVSLAEKDLRQIVKISEEISFKHTLFAENVLSYVLLLKGDFLEGMRYAEIAWNSMKWSALYDVQGAFDIRMGTAFASVGKMDDAIRWFTKALKEGRKGNHVFWYKSLTKLSSCFLFSLNKPAAAIVMIDSVTSLFPPVTVLEKLQVYSFLGLGYDFLRKPVLADRYFSQLLELANANKKVDPFGEMSSDYFMIAQLYLSRHHVKMARQFLMRGLAEERKDVGTLSLKYLFYYKMDSLNGNFKSALQNHIKYKINFDSLNNWEQRKQMNEFNMKNASERKDQDIKLLKQQAIAQKTEIMQNKMARNIMIGGTVLLLLIVGLLFNQFKVKLHANFTINKKNIALQRLVNEKEWLLKEVHHRVKNNMHTVISLLESQAAYLENDALKAIESSQHRIYAMSLIHQNLYQDKDVKTIDMALYVPEFIRYLDESFGTHYHIRILSNVDPISLGISQAIPVSLIINEAVTNSIKHAFPENGRGSIEISMRKVGKEITLLIVDNGVGIDESQVNTLPHSLGLKLIKGLAGDINASVKFSNDHGAIITIIFETDLLSNRANSGSDNSHELIYV